MREQAPAPRAAHLLVLSAKTAAALEQRAQDLAAHLEAHPEIALADVAFTLGAGRQRFAHRRAVAANDSAAAVTALRERAKLYREDQRQETGVVFIFPGQGSQYLGMGAQLHGTEPAFREAFDACLAALQPHLEFDLRATLWGEDAALLNEARVAQPAIFAFGYALARFWISLGLEPAALLGHSVGEFAAAAIAGVFTLEDAAAPGRHTRETGAGTPAWWHARGAPRRR